MYPKPKHARRGRTRDRQTGVRAGQPRSRETPGPRRFGQNQGRDGEQQQDRTVSRLDVQKSGERRRYPVDRTQGSWTGVEGSS